MQLIHGTYHDGAGYAAKRHAPAARAACNTGSHAHHAKDKQMRQFVPRRREQPNGNGLCAKNVKRCGRQDDGNARQDAKGTQGTAGGYGVQHDHDFVMPQAEWVRPC